MISEDKTLKDIEDYCDLILRTSKDVITVKEKQKEELKLDGNDL